MSHVKTNQDINSSKLTRTAHGKRPDVKAPHTHTLVPDQRSLRPAGRTLAGGRRGLRPCEALLPDYMAAAKEPCNMAMTRELHAHSRREHAANAIALSCHGHRPTVEAASCPHCTKHS